MFEGLDLGNMGKLMEQMQTKAKEIEAQAKNILLSVKAGGGLLEITANGAGEVVDLSIDDTLLEDKASLQILLISAMNEMNQKVEENKKSQAMGVMGGINPFGSR